MAIVIISIIAGLVLLAIGAEGLVRGSTSIALRLGVTPLVIGLTIVAFGTGSPELFISIQAALGGNSGIALGNVVGSNISNIALILGTAALIRPMRVRSQLILREMPLMIAVTLILCALLYDGEMSRIDGFILLAGAVAYTVITYIGARRDRSDVLAEEFGQGMRELARPVWLDVAFVVAGLVGLVVGARLLLGGATTIAEGLGVSQVVIGLTIVAIGTSLPELATSAVAAHRGEADIAFGNVIGSNILNVLGVLGMAAAIRPFAVEGLRPADIAVFIATAVLLLPLMWRGAVLNRWEGALLVAGYIVYLYSLVP